MVRKHWTKARSELTRETPTPLAPCPASGSLVSKGLGDLVPPALQHTLVFHLARFHAPWASLLGVMILASPTSPLQSRFSIAASSSSISVFLARTVLRGSRKLWRNNPQYLYSYIVLSSKASTMWMTVPTSADSEGWNFIPLGHSCISIYTLLLSRRGNTLGQLFLAFLTL